MTGRGFFRDIIKDQVLHQSKRPTAVFPRLYRDNLTKAPRTSFDMAQLSVISIRCELDAELSECTIYRMNMC
jgi:hypothetical protein